MNYFHRVIFNSSLGVRQVVSEIASAGRGGSTVSSTGLLQAPRLSALAAACLLAWCVAPQALAATCNAGTSAELATCIGGATAGDIVNLTASITLSANLGVIDKNLTINGNGNALDGAGAYRGFFVGAGTVTVNDLTMQNLRARGGNGGTDMLGGGGGMGAGGAVFVRSGAAVTLNNVALISNSAVGGAGGASVNNGLPRGAGGGGMGGNGGGSGSPTSGSAGQGGGGLFGNGFVSNSETGGGGGGPDGGTGTFNRSDALTAANAISGTGTLTQNGAGNLILTGTNTYAGATTVNAGTLSVNGSITSATTVNSGGKLGGNGSVGSVNVLAGGVLAPGNSIGTLTVNGNLTFAPGSIYRVETDAVGNADRVNVVGAPGTLTINGGTVDVQAGAGNYARNTSYTILSSTGATTGAFTGVTSNLAFLTPSLSYLPNGVTLNLLAENAPSYSTVAQTPNQASIANYLNSFANTPGNAEATALIQQVDNLTADQAQVAFDSMSGSQHAAASQVASAMGRNFSATLAARTGSTGLSNSGSSTAGLKAPLYAALSPALLTRSGDVVSDSPLRVAAADSSADTQHRPALQSVGGLWGQAMGTGGRIGSDGSGPESRYRANGFVLGYDQPVTSDWLAGAALAYNKAQWDASTNGAAPASGRIGSSQAGLYARYTDGPLQVRLDGSYSDHRFSTDRTVAIGNASSIARSSHGGTEWAFAAQAEYSMPTGDWDIRPLAGLRHARLSEDGFTETGAGAASLTVDARRSQNTVASLGMKFIRPLSQSLNQSKADTGILELRAIASHLMGDNDSPLSSRLAGQPGSFTATGTPLKRTALTLGGTLTGQLSRGLSAYADAAYEYRGSGQNAFQLTAGLKLAW